MLEQALHWAGGALYLSAAACAVWTHRRQRAHGLTLALLALALLVHGGHILMRWDRLGHGPYLNMFGALSGNVWTLHASMLIMGLGLPRLRPLLATALPLLGIMVVWLMVMEPRDSRFPDTFDTIWLAVHIWLGKFFMGLMLVAVASGLVVGLRWTLDDEALFPNLPKSGVLDELNFRLVGLAFVFDSLMLVAGAIWAQQAWGRFWYWDPLETWSFMTWVVVAIYLHVRFIVRPRPELSILLVFLSFALAFFTYFGIPFVSKFPHQGVV